MIEYCLTCGSNYLQHCPKCDAPEIDEQDCLAALVGVEAVVFQLESRYGKWNNQARTLRIILDKVGYYDYMSKPEEQQDNGK